MIISCDYLNLSNEYVGDITILIQVIKYNQNFLQTVQPISLQYSNQIKLFIVNISELVVIDKVTDYLLLTFQSSCDR